MNWPQDFFDLNELIISCKRCQKVCVDAIYPTPGIFPANLKNIKVLFVGQAPGFPLREEIEWRNQGNLDLEKISELYMLAMTMSRFGKWLNATVSGLKLDKWNEVAFTNTIKCYPPNHQILPIFEENCLSYFYKQLEFIDAKIYVPLGSFAFSKLTNNEYQSVSSFHAKKVLFKKKLLIPSFHPSFMMRQKKEIAKKYSYQLIKTINEQLDVI